MNQKKVIELLKSGNFTIAYHDNGCCFLYKGHMKYEQLPEEGLAEFYDSDGEGYLPEIVKLLTKALRGKSLTI